jgi:threonine/homoserine efflux transporter RhtA
LPPQSFFLASAVFHYLGPSLAVLLFARLDVLGVAWLPRATFSLMLALLPVFATVIGAIVLHQLPTREDVAGIALVVAGVALHQQAHRERT